MGKGGNVGLYLNPSGSGAISISARINPRYFLNAELRRRKESLSVCGAGGICLSLKYFSGFNFGNGSCLTIKSIGLLGSRYSNSYVLRSIFNIDLRRARLLKLIGKVGVGDVHKSS